MASYVMIVGDGFQGIVEFKDAKRAQKFYFNNCFPDAYTTLMHDQKPYKDRDKLELKD